LISIQAEPGTINGAAVRIFALITGKKQGAAGITTAAPYIAGQWGRGEDRLPG
jgi:hypothetical protein